MQNLIINITGTTCPACKKLIEKRIITIPNVVNVDVDFKTGKTIIDSNRLIGNKEISKVLEGLPYEPKD